MRKIQLFSILICMLFAPQIIHAQFNVLNMNYGQTNTNQRGIGIGDFSGNGANSTSSRFHINNFFCSQPTGALSGLLFRTDGRSNVNNMWQMFTGNNNNNLTEKFRFYVPANSDHLAIQTMRNNSMILFRTFQTNRMVILDGNPNDQQAGRVGIGRRFYTPTSLLHLNDGIFDTYFQITNTTTDTLATDGFRIGVLGPNGTIGTPATAGSVLLNQQEDHPMWFNTGSATGSLPRMTITSGNGFVGIGNYNNFVPNSLLHVDGNSIATQTGEVFRTTGPTAQNTFWRMFKTNIEMGCIFSQTSGTNINNNNLSVQASQQDITFNTLPLTNSIGQERMRVIGVSRTLMNPSANITTYPVTAVNVGIGNSNPHSLINSEKQVL